METLKCRKSCFEARFAPLTSTHLWCPSDDSDDSDGALGTGLSLDSPSQHAALTVKTEPCDQEDGLVDSKPYNGALLQGKGKWRLG